jgi:NAD(P)-dependent dehydrogenase (short-subunit alcohol dehydrogenase family)
MRGSMENKVAVVTGANTGIGKATAEGLARLGATVVLACRDLTKARAAADDLRAATGSTALHPMRLDLASLADVGAFARALVAEHPRLDVLIENAGVSTGRRRLSSDGHELDFAVNHLGHFHLTQLLLPSLKAAAPSRVVIVSSTVHKAAKLDFEDIEGERRWSVMGSYSRSKLANLLFMRELSRRLEGTRVTANALHPGVIASELARDFPAPLRFLTHLFFKSPEKGARTSLHLATAPELANVSGRYFVDCRETRPGRAALDDDAARRLWVLSEQLVAAVG